MDEAALAINGGTPVRTTPLPYRKLFGEAELEMVTQVFENSWDEGVDFGFQGKYENLYTDLFCEFQGGGFADAVSSGTAALYLALQAIQIEPGSDVVISPITDPGSVSPVIIAGMNPVVADSRPNSWNVGPKEFEAALTPNTKAAILTHLAGQPIDMDPILELAKSRGIKIIEDCSQSHGALYKNRKVGRSCDIAAFSTGFSKNHATGGCGGLVYTENLDYYSRLRSLADRGKAFDAQSFDRKQASKFLFPAMNFNQDELSCAIGYSTLSRLQDTINRRNEITAKIDAGLKSSSVVSACSVLPDTVPSPFFHTVAVDIDKLAVSKEEFATAVAAEGIWVNPRYDSVACEWEWLQEYLSQTTRTPNAVDFRNRTFNILFNENFTDQDINDVISSILKVESVMAQGSPASQLPSVGRA